MYRYPLSTVYDWTAYYKQKRNWISTYTQRFTLEKIIKTINGYVKNENGNGIKIMELGGGNSCFAKSICDIQKVSTYDIIDNNKLAVQLYNEQKIAAMSHYGFNQNLLDERLDSDLFHKYDFVFSVGLIEHFCEKDIETIICRHFEYCKLGGIVMITFPTPTKKYIIIRKIMEIFRIWQFHDEKPIIYQDIKKILETLGYVKEYYINRKLPLTQMVVIAEKGK